MTENQIIFICIGSNKITGDCLGPLVGTYLKQSLTSKNKNIKVYGDMNNPVDYTNINIIENKIKDIEYGTNHIIILIDSALGKNVGEIIIDTGNIELGIALYKNKTFFGDINIKGVVGENHNNKSKNMKELINVSADRINLMCADILNIINRKNWQSV